MTTYALHFRSGNDVSCLEGDANCQEATYVKRVSKECVYLLFTYSYSVKDFVTNRSVFICSSDVLAISSNSVLTNKIKDTLE